MQTPPRSLLGALAALVVAGGVVAWRVGPLREEPASVRVTSDPIRRGCGLDPDILTAIARGNRPGRSEDVTAVPNEPNYLGSFEVTSHSGPWRYLQQVPLVLYGPERVPELGPVEDEGVTLADVYPTVEDWTQVELEDRAGRSLTEAVIAKAGPPKLLVFVMWDGVGRNVLERWPGRWPNLERIEAEGVSYVNATVGSSPSITPSTHATLGTGTFPNEHGISGIQYRADDGRIKVAFGLRDPTDLEVTTFADDFDLALDNEPKVGLVGLRIWHMPMMGHGAATPGGDKDQLAIIGFEQRVSGNKTLYETPSYLHDFPGLEERIAELDRADGVADGRWREHPIADEHDSPAWARYQTDMVLDMLRREGYGDDSVTDLFFANYKMTDIVGHQYSMDSEEMGDVLEAQDEALGEILAYLDANVGDYALVLSADHGHTPSPERSGGWPISQDELERDLNRFFDIPAGDTLTQAITAVGPFLDPEILAAAGVTEADVARFMNGYTIGDNWAKGDLPEGYEDRGEEPVFEAAFPSDQLDEVMKCAFGTGAAASP